MPGCTGCVLHGVSFHPHHEDVMQRNGVSDSSVLKKGKKERRRERKVSSAAQAALQPQLREKQPS